MIARLNGILISKLPSEAVIDCGGVGYLSFISLNTYENLPEINEIAVLHTILIPREDAMQLYGFSTGHEREFFKLLISVSGIGPKIALGILSSLTISELYNYVATGNLIALQKLPGIGKKTAERLILELRDKVLKIEMPDKDISDSSNNMLKQEAVSALVALGYSRQVAEQSVKKVLKDTQSSKLSIEQLIRKSLAFAMS
jgi:holliday junction DNA helicase RuvA